jgi:hypothetical protein
MAPLPLSICGRRQQLPFCFFPSSSCLVASQVETPVLRFDFRCKLEVRKYYKEITKTSIVGNPKSDIANKLGPTNRAIPFATCIILGMSRTCFKQNFKLPSYRLVVEWGPTSSSTSRDSDLNCVVGLKLRSNFLQV